MSEDANSVALARNVSFSGWTTTSTDPRLYAATVDRLKLVGNIKITATSDWFAHIRAHRAAAT